jgi:hypothetical protein
VHRILSGGTPDNPVRQTRAHLGFFAPFFLNPNFDLLLICVEPLCTCRILSAFRPRGVPGPTSKLSPRAPAQMDRRETEREGGKNQRETCVTGETRGLRVCPAPRSGALAVGGYKRPRGREREAYARRPVPPRGQPSRTSALDLPFIGVRRGPRCTIGDVA